MQQLSITDLDRIRYNDALVIQTRQFQQLVDHKLQGVSNSDAHVLYLCEHEPVITLGKAANAQNVLLPEAILQEKGIDVVHISRGGDVTFHGPGQITGYPVLDLDFFTTDLKHYMRMLEEVIILTIAEYGLEGYRIADATGVWVDSVTDMQPKKIAAFGVKTSRWVTMHGFALNVDVDLNQFNHINPCGFTDKGVTSILNERSDRRHEISVAAVKQVLIAKFADVFKVQVKP